MRGLEKFGGKLQLNAHVDEIIVEEGRAVGVRLKNGKQVRAKVVVSNATPFDTVKMLGSKQDLPDGVRIWKEVSFLFFLANKSNSILKPSQL